MQGLIAFLIWLLIIENAVLIYLYTKIINRNNIVFFHEENIKRLCQEIDRLKSDLKESNEVILKIQNEELYDVGFALTPKGIKLLPKNWHERVWNKP